MFALWTFSVFFDVTSSFALFLMHFFCLSHTGLLAASATCQVWSDLRALVSPLPSLQKVSLPDPGRLSLPCFTWVSAQMASSQRTFSHHCNPSHFPPSLLPCLSIYNQIYMFISSFACDSHTWLCESRNWVSLVSYKPSAPRRCPVRCPVSFVRYSKNVK